MEANDPPEASLLENQGESETSEKLAYCRALLQLDEMLVIVGISWRQCHTGAQELIGRARVITDIGPNHFNVMSLFCELREHL